MSNMPDQIIDDFFVVRRYDDDAPLAMAKERAMSHGSSDRDLYKDHSAMLIARRGVT
jgi:hypothetical protein